MSIEQREGVLLLSIEEEVHCFYLRELYFSKDNGTINYKSIQFPSSCEKSKGLTFSFLYRSSTFDIDMIT